MEVDLSTKDPDPSLVNDQNCESVEDPQPITPLLFIFFKIIRDLKLYTTYDYYFISFHIVKHYLRGSLKHKNELHFIRMLCAGKHPKIGDYIFNRMLPIRKKRALILDRLIASMTKHGMCSDFHQGHSKAPILDRAQGKTPVESTCNELQSTLTKPDSLVQRKTTSEGNSEGVTCKSSRKITDRSRNHAKKRNEESIRGGILDKKAKTKPMKHDSNTQKVTKLSKVQSSVESDDKSDSNSPPPWQHDKRKRRLSPHSDDESICSSKLRFVIERDSKKQTARSNNSAIREPAIGPLAATVTNLVQIVERLETSMVEMKTSLTSPDNIFNDRIVTLVAQTMGSFIQEDGRRRSARIAMQMQAMDNELTGPELLQGMYEAGMQAGGPVPFDISKKGIGKSNKKTVKTVKSKKS